MALAGGDTIYHESNTPGGYTFQGHSTNATSLAKIASRDWDFVVLQEQSQIPSFPPSQVASDCYPYAAILVDSIRSNDACTEPVFFMTWGRKDGDQSNCQFYPPLCTFEGMNFRLRQSYLEMGANNGGTVAPCGAAWHAMSVADNFFWNGLYSGDGSHPSAWGTYLNACVFYATIFRQSPVGITYYSSIGQADAETLQQLAADIVLDSLSNWSIGHQDVVSNADFAFNSGLEVQFVANSENATDHFWTFGDGETSTDENPIHAYQTTETFTVTHIAFSNCDADTTMLQLTTNALGIDNQAALNEVVVAQNGDIFTVRNPLNRTLSVSILDISGRRIFTESIQSNSTKTFDLNASNGIYLLQLSDGYEQATRKVALD